MPKTMSTARRQFDKGFEIFEFNFSGRFEQGRNIFGARGSDIDGAEFRTKPDADFDTYIIAYARHDARGQSVSHSPKTHAERRTRRGPNR